MGGRRRGAGWSRAAERRRRAARCRIHLEARNASIARVGLLGLLAQDHGLVAAADRARRRLEAERGALREAEPRRSADDRGDQAHCGDTRSHGRASAPPMRPQRTIPLIVPGGNRFLGWQRSPDGRYTSRTTLRTRRRDWVAHPFSVVLAAPQLGCPLFCSHTSRSSARLASFS